MRYKKVATGGTFDHLHRGHRHLLEKSFDAGEEVVIGVTSDEFAQKMGKKPDYTYDIRVGELRKFLEDRFPGRKYTIARLYDYFGPGIASADVEAIVASAETAERVPSANRLRAEKGFRPLNVVVVNWALAEDGKPISSTRIRKGELDAEGRILKKS